jgi:uncharacterized protein (TIGR02757 family)
VSAEHRFGTDDLREVLDALYETYTLPAYVHPDPVEFVRPFSELQDREIVALLAAGLSYGRVASILNSIADLLARIGPGPARFVDGASPAELSDVMAGFKHRWTGADDVAHLLLAIKRMRAESGSMHQAFLAGFDAGDDTILPALTRWVRRLRQGSEGRNSLIADPGRGSACKRLLLFLRWMVRADAVDPGGWHGIPRSTLVVPVDVHMHRVGRALGFTDRANAAWTTALDITRGFARVCPEDPVKYDFALTRPGILSAADLRTVLDGPDADLHALLRLPSPPPAWRPAASPAIGCS